MSDSSRPHGLQPTYQAPPSLGFSRQEYWSWVASAFSLRVTIGYIKDTELGGVRVESLVSPLLLALCVTFGESVALSWTQVFPSVQSQPDILWHGV